MGTDQRPGDRGDPCDWPDSPVGGCDDPAGGSDTPAGGCDHPVGGSGYPAARHLHRPAEYGSGTDPDVRWNEPGPMRVHRAWFVLVGS